MTGRRVPGAVDMTVMAHISKLLTGCSSFSELTELFSDPLALALRAGV